MPRHLPLPEQMARYARHRRSTGVYDNITSPPPIVSDTHAPDGRLPNSRFDTRERRRLTKSAGEYYVV